MCFPAGTLIGAVPIELMLPNLLVPTFNLLTSTIALQPVNGVFRRVATRGVRLHFVSGRTLELTAEQRVWNVDLNAFLRAGDMGVNSVARYMSPAQRTTEPSDAVWISTALVIPDTVTSIDDVVGPNDNCYNLWTTTNRNFFASGYLVSEHLL